ncbi:MAG: vWA domain-containing protein [bacterium]
MKLNLADYIRHYVKRVIGLNIPVEDSPQPCAVYQPKQILGLPVSEKTLGQFLGEEFVSNASKELLFSIIIGLGYHEAAHLLSGEDNITEPHILNNVICDSNDFNFVPNTWPGSVPFTLSLVNTTYQQSPDIADIPLKTKKDELCALLELAIEFMRKRRVKFEKKDVKELVDCHPLHDAFEKIKPIVKEARKAKIKDRPTLVKQLFEVLKGYWVEEEKQKGKGKKKGKPSPELTAEMLDKLTKSAGAGRKLNKSDVSKLQRLAEQSGVLSKCREVMQKVEKEIAKEALERIHSCIDKPYDLHEQKEMSSYPPQINDQIVSEIRNTLKPILFQRAIKRMAPSTVGIRFSSSHFHEIKTNPDKPRIRRDVKRIARTIDETNIILCFDRSGSMAGEKQETTVQIASNLYKALSTIPKVKTQLLGFNDVPNLIKGNRAVSMDTALRRIPLGLQAQGGTNFPLALKECLRLAKETQAHKKLVIILTDGDLAGDFPIRDLLVYAEEYRIEVICVGIKGSNVFELKLHFDKSIYVDRINDLPRKLKEVTLSNI